MKKAHYSRRYPRWKRKRQILRILHDWAHDTLTMSQIAFWLDGAKASNHILKILHEMESDHMVSSKRVAYRKNATQLNWKITMVGVAVVNTLEALAGTNYEI